MVTGQLCTMTSLQPCTYFYGIDLWKCKHWVNSSGFFPVAPRIFVPSAMPRACLFLMPSPRCVHRAAHLCPARSAHELSLRVGLHVLTGGKAMHRCAGQCAFPPEDPCVCSLFSTTRAFLKQLRPASGENTVSLVWGCRAPASGLLVAGLSPNGRRAWRAPPHPTPRHCPEGRTG